jgi:dihydrofolate reductase
MSEMLWHITMSLDGFIAGPDLSRCQDEVGKAHGGAWTGPVFVLTHSAAETAAPGFTFVGHDFETAVETVKAAAGEKYIAILGASTTKQVLHAGLLDEILVRIASVLLGDGVRLLDHPEERKLDWQASC